MSIDADTPVRQRGQRAWTDAQRAEQGRRTRERKIWEKSTGPKTENGKRTSARNSYKHGRFAYERQLLRWYVRLAATRVKHIKTHLNHEDYKRENELRNKYGNPRPPRSHIMAFYPYFKVHPLAPKVKQPKKLKTDQEVFDFFDNLSDFLERLRKDRK